MKIPFPKAFSLTLLITFSLVTAHSAPAKATHLFVLGAPQFSKPVSLSEVTEKKKMGLGLESQATQTRLLLQAQNYLSYRKPSSFLSSAQCAGSAFSQNPFCGLETERQLSHMPQPAPTLLSEMDEEIVHTKSLKPADLTSQSPEALSFYPLGLLAHAMRSFDDFTPLQPLSDKVLSAQKTCYSSALYTALGLKLEESFPKPEAIATTEKLYSRAAECGADKAAMQARYRLSLIRIWQNSCDHVVELLGEVEKSNLTAAYHARARYWRYQCADKLGLQDIKAQTREALWQKNPMSYHNIAINGNDPRLAALLHSDAIPFVQFRSVLRPDLNPKVAAIETLLQLKSAALAAEFIDQISTQLSSSEPEFRLYLAALVDRTENAIPKFKILASLLSDVPRSLNLATLKLYFPLSFFSLIKARATAVDPLLVLALMRQESAFNQRARSAVGARGLMQVMPATARSIASVSSVQLYQPVININVGTNYLKQKLSYFNGDLGPTLASYNAGVARVDRWLKRYPGADQILFADLIPFHETSDYVSSILRNHFWYTRLYPKTMLISNKQAIRKNAGM
jgi:soluble lytic murein transglycosylase